VKWNRDRGDEEAGVGLMAVERDTKVDAIDTDRVKGVPMRRIEDAQGRKEIGEPAVAALKAPEIANSKDEEEDEVGFQVERQYYCHFLQSRKLRRRAWLMGR